MQGYQDRSKYRAVIGTKFARELILKIDRHGQRHLVRSRSDSTTILSRTRPGAASARDRQRASRSPLHIL